MNTKNKPHLYERERKDYRIALARRADKGDKALTLAQARKVLGLKSRQKNRDRQLSEK